MIKSEVKVNFKTQAFVRSVDATARREVFRIALDTANHAKISIQTGPKTGIVYKRPKGSGQGQFHRASAGGKHPPESPATDTGMLASHITFPEFSSDGLTATVTSEAPYSIHLEEGTSRMAARPFMKPALMEAMREHDIRIKSIFRKIK